SSASSESALVTPKCSAAAQGGHELTCRARARGRLVVVALLKGPPDLPHDLEGTLIDHFVPRQEVLPFASSGGRSNYRRIGYRPALGRARGLRGRLRGRRSSVLGKADFGRLGDGMGRRRRVGAPGYQQ